jgi:IS5 family transposase
VDANIVEAPRQRNTREENARIKRGERPASFDAPGRPARGRQKDTEARWPKKRQQNHFGYKNHINPDAKYKFVRKYQITDAATHDNQLVDALLDQHNQNRSVFGDSAYRSAAISERLQQQGHRDRTHQQAQEQHAADRAAEAAQQAKVEGAGAGRARVRPPGSVRVSPECHIHPVHRVEASAGGTGASQSGL